MKRGEIHRVKADRIGAGKPGRRVLVVSREELNRGYEVTIVPFNGSDFANKSKKPFCVPFNCGEFGLVKDCVAKCDEINRIYKNDLVTPSSPVGEISEDKLAEVLSAINWCLKSEPKK